jgi:hypothetical protein
MVSLWFPLDGDVIVRLRQRNAAASYVMSVVPGVDQFAYASRAEAIKKALKYAKRACVTAWYVEREGRFERLGVFRTMGVHGIA